MYEAYRIMNGQMIKMGNVIKDIKDGCKEKYLCKYQKIAPMFHDEDYEQANREARDLICELNGRGVRNNHVFSRSILLAFMPVSKQGLRILH
jgi:hypothetical protein